jgi:predicted permease
MAVLVLALRPLLERHLGIDGPSFTSIFQGATRWNTFVGLAVAGSLFGQRGIALIAVAIAAHGAPAQSAGLLCLHPLCGPAEAKPWDILRSFVTNPFIWSCAVA